MSHGYLRNIPTLVTYISVFLWESELQTGGSTLKYSICGFHCWCSDVLSCLYCAHHVKFHQVLTFYIASFHKQLLICNKQHMILLLIINATLYFCTLNTVNYLKTTCDRDRTVEKNLISRNQTEMYTAIESHTCHWIFGKEMYWLKDYFPSTDGEYFQHKWGNGYIILENDPLKGNMFLK